MAAMIVLLMGSWGKRGAFSRQGGVTGKKLRFVLEMEQALYVQANT